MKRKLLIPMAMLCLALSGCYDDSQNGVVWKQQPQFPEYRHKLGPPQNTDNALAFKVRVEYE